MSPALKTTLFVSIALASFAGAANAGSYKRLHLGSVPLLESPLGSTLGYALDDTDYDDPDLTTISGATRAAVRMLEEDDIVEEVLGDLEE
jgi:hypothetical protein